MNDIRALLKLAARRLELNSFLAVLHVVLLIAAGAALALMLADRAPASGFVPWAWVAPAIAVAAAGMAVGLWLRRRPSEAHVAVVVDERLELREKLSTALHCQGRTDSFAQAAIEDAVHTARDPRTRERVNRGFAVTPPGGWWISPLLVLAAIMISFIDPLNLFARTPRNEPEIQQAAIQAEQSIDAVVKAIEQQPELKKELEELLGEMSKEGTDPNAPFKKPEDLKRDALKKVTDLSKKLDELMNGEKGKTKEALEQALNKLETPEDGAAKELAEALAEGNFTKAQEALKELLEKAQNGELTEEQKQQAAEQLEKIAEQLEKLAQQQQQLEQALKQAGMDPNLAQNAQALQQAIQNNQNLNQQQKQELQQMAQAQQAAAQMCQGLGQACQNMAQGLNGKMGMGQAAGQMGAQLSDMEQLQMMLQQAQAAQSACQGQCNKLGQGLAMKPGGAFGQRGQGAGGKAPLAPTPTGTKMEKANINTVEGDIIAKQLFDGQQLRGESRAKLVQVVREANEGFDEGQTEDVLHVKYREAQQHYFGELEKLTKAIVAEDAKPAGPQESPKPAEGEEAKSGPPSGG